MPVYIAMLRGINVSGQKMVKMADLRAYLKELNFENIQTYIQSGNVIFQFRKTAEKQLAAMIRNKIVEKYNFDVPTLVKTPAVLEQVIGGTPFKAKDGRDLKQLYITFLEDFPAEEAISKLSQVDHSPEEYVLDGLNIYFYSPQGYGKAKMNNNFFEKKLKVSATTRNWKTINKLLEMAGS